MYITSVFEPAGEQCGTIYDETRACEICGASPPQISALRLDLRRVPRADITRTIANEAVVSERFVEAFHKADLSGADFDAVQHAPRFDDESLDLSSVPSGRELLKRACDEGVELNSDEFWRWINKRAQKEVVERAHREAIENKARSYQKRAARRHLPSVFQLNINSARLGVIAPTRTGLDPFDGDPDGEYRCPRGDTIGFRFLTELTVSRDDWDRADISLTKQCIGVPRRGGLITPWRGILVSPKFRELVLREKFKGVSFEIAHFG
ncbi:MAG TPA: hypothetical protein VFB15_13445 [Candidatus Binataceae bacterium]|nr:hypothetical protein [Candidatus Binataceae bacterium]